MIDNLTAKDLLVFKIQLFIILFLVLTTFGFNVQTVFAQNTAADHFDEFCADCHSIGEGDMKGPDLLGVEQKYSEDWLVKFIHSSKTLINSGDPKAVATFEKYKKQNMPDTDLSVSEIRALIAYIKSFNKNTAKKPSITNDSLDVSNIKEIKSVIQATVEEALEARQYNERLGSIEKKLDVLLQYNRKSLSARITDEEIEKGRKLFEGIIPFTGNVPACVTCHNTFKIDTLNWNPSAFDIATAFSQRNDADITSLIINPVSNKMKAVLNGHRLADYEAFYITAYLQSIERTGLIEYKKLPVKLLVFIGLCLVMMFSLIDLMFTKIIKLKLLNIFIFIVTGILISNTIYVNAANIGLSQNYAPDQPIKFSHEIHVKENKIECLFCHNGPEFSRESGIPSTNVCMICHNKIRTGERTGQFEINKIVKTFENKIPIEWIKVHNLPDHVFFSHAQHVSVGKIECRTCHGDIDEMHITRQVSTLSMGWCVNCHRESKVQFEENKFYSEHQELHDDLKSGKIRMVTADKIGANDCQTCHY
ncbi:MAG: hypothetical protein A2X05_01665 [Bacteroidetes bacterium GWE2_41_25]|nr:MAG: hypothetical protein A2X06_11985 [Bacteroidetes bacterium GWC2_40_22]OFY09781.1 MAG: hypothetical protein A2X05_01665 [Bacteroidetes bacterium GWE2_41_25]HBH83726.1 hypothetical protein [Bacteroidales bacterium]HCU20783.1 hypothetical protein [Bacteroidales bacterium]